MTEDAAKAAAWQLQADLKSQGVDARFIWCLKQVLAATDAQLADWTAFVAGALPNVP